MRLLPPLPPLMLPVLLTAFAIPVFLRAAQEPSVPEKSTATLGAFIMPVDAQASSAQLNAGRTPRRLIDGSGWGETRPGSAVFVHSNNVYADGSSMWNGAADAWLRFDLGKPYRLNGFYLWNYNEGGGWHTRSVRTIEVTASVDGATFTPVGTLTVKAATGQPNDPGEAVAFPGPVTARYIRFQIRSNYRGGEMSGMAEIRFAHADEKAPEPGRIAAWKPTYPRPAFPALKRGERLKGAENIVFPANAGIVDVTKPPYNAKGDGVTDDTASIQKALADHPNQGAIIYLPNGVYLVSDTLKWPHGKGTGDEEKRTTMQGQSRDGTILRLKDRCDGYQNPRQRKAVLWTGKAPAQRFGNEIHNLTVDTGVANPGASGIQFIANNQGGVFDVTIRSGDGQGVYGLDMGYTDEQGPCLVKNVRVQGFDVGIHVATNVASEVFEHITVENQNVCGFRNDGQPCTVRGLRSVNRVPAFHAGGGFSVLTDCTFTGIGDAKGRAALLAEAPVSVRNLKTSGYGIAIADRLHNKGDVAGPSVPLFLSKPAARLTEGTAAPLALPVRETPAVPNDDPKIWVSPKSRDSAGIQAAIDAGATTVYLPRGAYRIDGTIRIRGNVRRIVGCKAGLETTEAFRKSGQSVFRFEDSATPVVVLEGIATDFSSGSHYFMEHAALKRTLVLRNVMINFQAADAYRSVGGGTVFLEDVVGRYFTFNNQNVWARQFNVEGDGTHVKNNGGTLWILHLKTEGRGTLIETTNGGRTELIGGLTYTVGDPAKFGPMFVVDNARASFTFAEVCYDGKPFPIVLHEKQGETVKEMPRADPRWGGYLTLLSAGPAAP
jgi:hypothetical protein